jgi:hypothetical protein
MCGSDGKEGEWRLAVDKRKNGRSNWYMERS